MRARRERRQLRAIRIDEFEFANVVGDHPRAVHAQLHDELGIERFGHCATLIDIRKAAERQPRVSPERPQAPGLSKAGDRCYRCILFA